MTTVLVAVLALHAAVAVGAAIHSTTPPLPQGLRGATDEPLQLHLFTATTVASKHTVCLDGSPSGFYFRPASTPASAQKWVFFLQGGGLCVEPVDCLERTKSALGSSSKWPSQAEQAYVAPGLLSSNLTLSPWATYNHVWLRYCTGDCHAGMETKKNLDGLQFSGFFQITETIFALNATYGFLTRAGSFGHGCCTSRLFSKRIPHSTNHPTNHPPPPHTPPTPFSLPPNPPSTPRGRALGWRVCWRDWRVQHGQLCV